jgi:hypothetical protein
MKALLREDYAAADEARRLLRLVYTDMTWQQRETDEGKPCLLFSQIRRSPRGEVTVFVEPLEAQGPLPGGWRVILARTMDHVLAVGESPREALGSACNQLEDYFRSQVAVATGASDVVNTLLQEAQA